MEMHKELEGFVRMSMRLILTKMTDTNVNAFRESLNCSVINIMAVVTR